MSARNSNKKDIDSQRTVKLRDSCEMCAAAKVKCNKDKPTCSRCLQRGFKCAYGASRRQGRPAQNTQNSQVQVQPQHKNNDNQDDRVLDTNLMLPGSVVPNEWLASMLDAPWDDFPMDDLSPNASDSRSLTEMSSQPKLNDGQPMVVLFESSSDASIASDVNHESSDGLHSDKDGTHCNPEYSCLSIALDLLRRSSTTEAFKACPRRQLGQGRQVPPSSLETVVSMNKSQIESVGMLLDCSCTLDGNLLHTVWLILLNIITGYARAVTGATCPVLSNEPLTAPPTIPFPLKNLLEKTPEGCDGLLKGVSGPRDGQAQATVQAALDDLYQIQDVVNRFSQKIQAARLREESSRLNSTTPQGSVDQRSDIQAAMLDRSWLLYQATSSQVEADLRRRLRAVTLQVVRILVQG